ncbi:DUF397 domain-containing protein [Streptomyces spiramyceticus]|uniref:DUF397 domain-containing protein n=1 Tax=Streptomyces spiramyceticus TaxID=299717 RepID=UPI00237A4555|nr:DUF397 domain-containing protein [Streptomyces spiramyceticus]
MTLPSTVQWQKSSYSNGMGGECLEFAAVPTGAFVRDSKRPAEALMAVGGVAWSEFIRAVHRGELNAH